MKVRLSLANSATADLALVADAIDWLGTYIEDSTQVAAKYLAPRFVQNLLTPLKDKFPFTPYAGKVFHLSSSCPQKLTSSKVLSCLYFEGKPNWQSIAYKVGLDDEYYAYEMPQSIVQLFTHDWLHTYVRPFVVKNEKKLKSATNSPEAIGRFLKIVSGSEYQCEIIAYVPRTVTLTKPVFEYG